MYFILGKGKQKTTTKKSQLQVRRSKYNKNTTKYDIIEVNNNDNMNGKKTASRKCVGHGEEAGAGRGRGREGGKDGRGGRTEALHLHKLIKRS